MKPLRRYSSQVTARPTSLILDHKEMPRAGQHDRSTESATWGGHVDLLASRWMHHSSELIRGHWVVNVMWRRCVSERTSAHAETTPLHMLDGVTQAEAEGRQVAHHKLRITSCPYDRSGAVGMGGGCIRGMWGDRVGVGGLETNVVRGAPVPLVVSAAATQRVSGRHG